MFYLCAELYFLSCGLGAESVPRTLPLPALIFATPVLSCQFTIILRFSSLGTTEASEHHTHSHTYMHTHGHRSTHSQTLFGKALSSLWSLGFAHSPQLPLKCTVAFPMVPLIPPPSHLAFPSRAGVLGSLRKKPVIGMSPLQCVRPPAKLCKHSDALVTPSPNSSAPVQLR